VLPSLRGMAHPRMYQDDDPYLADASYRQVALKRMLEALDT
jgi:hypothetical protein